MSGAPRLPWLPLLATACLSAGLLLVACGGGPAPSPEPTATVAPPDATPTAPSGPVALEEVAAGFKRPTFVTHAGDGSGRLFVVEKSGIIRVIRNGAVEAEPFLNMTSFVWSTGNEQGLLGLAFHPKFKENGRFFVAFTAQDGANSVAEYRVPAGSTRADPATARRLLAIPDDRENHNGGMLAFGPDGYLYIGTGDGGGAGDTRGTGQSLNTLLGKILRVDVDSGTTPYGIPPDNPFAGRSGARPEIWAYGLRNPWRFSFDRATGDLWIGDVGQDAREEVDFQPAGSKGGENYGWNAMEASACFRPSTGCARDGKVPPASEYSHAGGACSVTGGYVYRGSRVPAIAGAYVFIDYCDGQLRSLRPDGNRWRPGVLLETSLNVSSFGEDEAGELYVVDDTGGRVYRLVAGAP
ncbi:MAG: PQQ-dependent sugar dehydrogenase [Chloroflexi bacterium]|nr:PQQ-dependent sugar dehydrogenase [Chloroflexota bacterium]